MRTLKIVILSEGFGAGHTRAAEALSIRLKRFAPNVRTNVLELGTELHPTLAQVVLSAYRRTLRATPKLYGLLYRQQLGKSLGRFNQFALHRLFYARTAELIDRLKPDAIVCTHPFPTVVVSRLKRLGLNIPLCTVITDYSAHGTWITPETDKYLVSTPEVKRDFAERGVPPDIIDVTGIPVHPTFWKRPNKDEIRGRYRLRQMPTVLIMGGGWGLVDRTPVLKQIAAWRDRLQLLFCMGNNEKALHQMQRDPLFQHENVRVFGFIHDVDELMEVSDLLVTKPGGMTCTEGMAKGIPMLFYDPIPGQEEDNCRYFVRMGNGELIQSAQTIDTWFRKLADRDPSLGIRRAESLAAVHHFFADACAMSIMQLFQDRAPSTLRLFDCTARVPTATSQR